VPALTKPSIGSRRLEPCSGCRPENRPHKPRRGVGNLLSDAKAGFVQELDNASSGPSPQHQREPQERTPDDPVADTWMLRAAKLFTHQCPIRQPAQRLESVVSEA
jgi:hypothetical protein